MISLGATRASGRHLDLKLQSSWSPLQRRLASILGNAWFDFMMGMVVVFNMVLVIIETDAGARCHGKSVEECNPDKAEVVACNWVLLSVYVVELLLQLYVFRLSYFRNIWNTLDSLVVVLSVVAEIIGSFARNFEALRLLRLLRITRVVRL